MLQPILHYFGHGSCRGRLAWMVLCMVLAAALSLGIGYLLYVRMPMLDSTVDTTMVNEPIWLLQYYTSGSEKQEYAGITADQVRLLMGRHMPASRNAKYKNTSFTIIDMRTDEIYDFFVSPAYLIVLSNSKGFAYPDKAVPDNSDQERVEFLVGGTATPILKKYAVDPRFFFRVLDSILSGKDPEHCRWIYD